MLQITLEEPGRFSSADVAEPQPVPGEALVRVRRIGVCGTDRHAFSGRQPFFSYPRVLGHELGVEVIDPGTAPNGLRSGDRCAVEPYLNCGHCVACRRGRPNCCADLKVLGVHLDGGMRPLIAVPSHKLHVSRGLDFEQLALVEMLGIGAHAVARAQLSRGDFALVIGAGPIGLSVVQFALLSGATVAVLEIHGTRLNHCREKLGVEHAFMAGAGALEAIRAAGLGEMPGVVFDATGERSSMEAAFDLAAPGGRIVFVGLVPGSISLDDPNFHRRELTLLASRNAPPETFRDIIRLMEDGRFDTRPWITDRFALADTPGAFPSRIAGNLEVVKAVIGVE